MYNIPTIYCNFLWEKIILLFKSIRFGVCIGDESFDILVRNNLQYNYYFFVHW